MRCVIVHVLGHLEIFILLVNGIIGQVHVEIIKLVFARVIIDRLVLVSCKPDHTFFIEKDLERLTAKHEYVQSQVELKAVKEIWILHVLLDYEALVLGDLIEIIG